MFISILKEYVINFCSLIIMDVFTCSICPWWEVVNSYKSQFISSKPDIIFRCVSSSLFNDIKVNFLLLLLPIPLLSYVSILHIPH